MRTWTADAWLAGPPEEVLELLTRPSCITRWSPVCFNLVELDDERLVTGSRARVRGALAGRTVEFTVEVDEASDDCLALLATGPVEMEVEYLVAPLDCGSEVRASVTVTGRGMLGRVLARAVEALLAAGALEHAVGRIARSLEPAFA